MKTTTILLGALLMTFTIALGAQQPSAGATTPAADRTFVMHAAQANLAEVELGKLALKKTQRDDVKKFGQQMIDDHSKAGDELKAIAARKNIAVPADLDAEHKALYDRLSKLSGAAFDQAYMKAMADGHRKVSAEVRQESRSGMDTEVKAWAAKTLPTIEAHLTHADSVNRAVHPAGSTH
jgi:putative membrane protein